MNKYTEQCLGYESVTESYESSPTPQPVGKGSKTHGF